MVADDQDLGKNLKECSKFKNWSWFNLKVKENIKDIISHKLSCSFFQIFESHIFILDLSNWESKDKIF